MESAYAESQRGSEVHRRRRTGQDSVPPATEALPGFRVGLVGDGHTPLPIRLKIAHESGNWTEHPLREQATFMTFPGLTPEAGGTWLLSLSMQDYRGVDSHPLLWPVRETLTLRAIDGDAPDVTVEIESLKYTYEPGIEGPLVTYPARSSAPS